MLPHAYVWNHDQHHLLCLVFRTWGKFTFSEKHWRHIVVFFRSSLSVFCWIASSYCLYFFFSISIFKCFKRILLNSAIFSFLYMCALNSRSDGKQILSNKIAFMSFTKNIKALWVVWTQYTRNIQTYTETLVDNQKTGRIKLLYNTVFLWWLFGPFVWVDMNLRVLVE